MLTALAAAVASPATANADGCASGLGGSYSVGSSSCSSTAQFQHCVRRIDRATATGTANLASAFGNGSAAEASNGNRNTAIPQQALNGIGHERQQQRGESSGLRAGAIAQNRNRRRASSFGMDVGSVAEGIDAQEVGTGNNNRAFAIGGQPGAIAQNGNNNWSLPLGTGSGSVAKNGNRNSATTIGNNSSATATGIGTRVTTVGDTNP